MSFRYARVCASLAVLALGAASAACSGCTITSTAAPSTSPEGSVATPAPTSTGSTAPSTPAGPNVVGLAGIAAWDALADKAAISRFDSLYLHQSVGQDLEDGAEAVGYRFSYYGAENHAGQALEPGLSGGTFIDFASLANGEPMKKMAAVRKALAVHKAKLRVLFFSFGYADVREEDLPAVEAEYAKLVGEVKAAGLRFVHVTPPLVYSVAENPPKMKMRSWMIDTFKSDTIFDLQDIESMDNGKRCEEGGVWRICQANRSTDACPSKSQGVDGDGAGHICATRAQSFAKAFLFAIHRAGR
jgi:hypothetical protein